MPLEQWDRFLAAIGLTEDQGLPLPNSRLREAACFTKARRRLTTLPGSDPRGWTGFLLRIVLPAVLAVVLFVIVTFVILIPSSRTNCSRARRRPPKS